MVAPASASGLQSPAREPLTSGDPFEVKSFAGLGQINDVSSGLGPIEPPDPWVAVGPNHVMQAVNSLVRISDRNGKLVEQSTAASFFGVRANQEAESDPHVVFDPAHQRWIGSYISFDCSSGFLYFVVSTSADPTGAWDGWYFTFPGVVPDYPDIGFSADKIAVAQNVFPIQLGGGGCDLGPTSNGSSILVLDWDAVLAGGALPNSYFAANPTFWTWRPSRNLSSDASIHLVAENFATGDVIGGTITGTVAQSNVTRTSVDMTSTLSLPVFGNQMPPAPRQPGSPSTISAAVDERPTDAVWQNGSMWFVSTFGCVPAGDSVLRDCVRVTQISTAGPSVVQDFAIGFSGYDTFMGGIGLAGNGAAYFVYSTSSASHFVSTWMNAQAPGDAAMSLRPTVLLAQGLATYSGARWGDYVGVPTDPAVSDAVWQADEYPNASGDWATKVSMLRLESAPDAPTGVSGLAGDSSVKVSWLAPAWNGGSPITAYTVTSMPDSQTCVTSGTLFCTVTGLTNGTTYRFTVAASNADGTGPASAASAPVTPAPPPPTPPTAAIHPLPTFLVSTSIPVSWSATAGSAAVTTYDVRYRRAAWNGSFGSYVTWLGGTPATSSAFSASTGQTYCFSSRAHDALGSVSAWTAETCVGIPLDDRSLVVSGSWTAGTGSSFYRNTYRRSSTSGAGLVRTGVIARRISIVATTCSTCGKVRVYWGSTLLRTINLYSSSTIGPRVLTVATFSSGRVGTVTIRVFGSGKRVLMDGLAIRRN